MAVVENAKRVISITVRLPASSCLLQLYLVQHRHEAKLYSINI